MKYKKILFVDLDGTLIDTLSGKTLPEGLWDMTPKFDVWNAIKKLNPWFIGIATNQGGIEKGFVSHKFEDKLKYIATCLSEYTGVPVGYQFCTSNDKNNYDRKPNPGMMSYLLSDAVRIDPSIKYTTEEDMLMIGDASGKPGQFSNSDKRTAKNFGIDYMDVDDFVEWSKNNYLHQ